MRNFKYILYILVLFSFLNQSCKDYLDINENPNQAVTATPELVLTNALNVTASRLSHNEVGSFWAGQWSPSGSVSGFVEEKTYDITTSFRTEIWSGVYDNLTDYKYVLEKAREENKVALVGIAQVMKAYNYQILVDAYNNVPYTDALQGTKVIRPDYTNASLIYDSLVYELNLAIENLKVKTSSDNPSPGATDIYFRGDLEKWIRFANTLKLRMLLRQIHLEEKRSFIVSEINKIEQNGYGFLGADESVLSNPGYIKTGGKMNSFYELYGFTASDAPALRHDFYAYSDFLISQLHNTNDSLRLSRLASKSASGEFRGVPLGEGGDAYLYQKVSGFGPAFLPARGFSASSDLYNRPQVVFTSAESFFLQAEAVERGLLSSGDAKLLYEMGITESFKMLNAAEDGISPEEAAVLYYSQPLEFVNWDYSPDKIATIISQKWVALATYNGFEAWCEYRRTGYPVIPLSIRAVQSFHPKRLLYPLSEYSNNAENVNAEGAVDQFVNKIFWMPE